MKVFVFAMAAMLSSISAAGALPLSPAPLQQSVADGFGADLFAPPVALAGTVSMSNGKLASGDVNEDGWPDLVGYDDFFNRIVLFLNLGGAGGGAFAPAVQIQVLSAFLMFPQPRLVDLNGDGHLDLLGVMPTSGAVSARLGDGTGAFGELLASGGGISDGHAFDVADLDGDGVLDIVLTHGFFLISYGEILIMTGDGDGTFGALQPVISARRPELVLARDFDGDAIADLLFTESTGELTDVLVVHHGVGGGAFAPGVAVPLAADNPGALDAADANGDGILDIYVAFPLPGLVEILIGAGDGSFAPGVEVAFPQLALDYLDVADMDRDGMPDVIVSTADQVLVQRMSRTGPIGAPASTPPYGAGFGDLLADDFDQDGLPDVARCGDDLEVLTGALGPFIDIGYGGTAGVGTPELVILGTPAARQVVTGGVSGLPLLAFGLIFFGVDAEYTPFNGGVLVPSPDVQFGTVAGVGFALGWPAGIPAGTAIYAQAVMLSGAGLTQPLPSNAVVIIAE